MSTVKVNKEYHKKHRIKAVDALRDHQERCGWSSSTNLKKYIKERHIINYPYLETSVDHRDDIYGPHPQYLKER